MQCLIFFSSSLIPYLVFYIPQSLPAEASWRRQAHSAFVTPHPICHIIGHFLISQISPTVRKHFKSKGYKQTPLAQKMLIIVTGSVSDIVR